MRRAPELRALGEGAAHSSGALSRDCMSFDCQHKEHLPENDYEHCRCFGSGEDNIQELTLLARNVFFEHDYQSYSITPQLLYLLNGYTTRIPGGVTAGQVRGRSL